MEQETRTQLQTSLLEEMNEIKKTLRTRNAEGFAHSFLFVIQCATKMDELQDINYQPNNLWKGQKPIKKL